MKTILRFVKSFVRVNLLLLALMVSSNTALCGVSGKTRVIEKSSRKKPSWVHGLVDGYIVAEGVGVNFNQAKFDALQKVKSYIVESITEQIDYTTSLQSKNIIEGSRVSTNEVFRSTTRMQSKYKPVLSGISFCKVSDFYWEKIRSNKEISIHYHIKYPFTTTALDSIINQCKIEDELNSKKLIEIEKSLNEYVTVEDIVYNIYQLERLKSKFIDRRSIKVEALIIEQKKNLNNIKIEVITNEIDLIRYRLLLYGKEIFTKQVPKIKSNCANITSVTYKNNYYEIRYNTNQCKLDNNTRIQISYQFSDIFIAKTISVKVEEKDAIITGPIDYIKIIYLNDGKYWDNSKIYCEFSIQSMNSAPYIIERIEIDMVYSWTNFWTGSKMYENANPLNIFCSKKIKKGKGNQFLRYSLNKKLGEGYSEDYEKVASGKIYYKSVKSGERKVVRFDNVKLYI